jgi:hypothetical protein
MTLTLTILAALALIAFVIVAVLHACRFTLK